ncbi:biopolymer transporter ExbD [Bacteroidales bacterium OttesenSCG-928-M06]|nr:biopolymer transporter ExbD [Bacteroidales bacterium OttesenSCG-928-M06]
MGRVKRKIPQINSSSSADIAFLLLIFFLITSSLDSKMGIYRKLNASSPEDVLKEGRDIEDRNLLIFTIDSLNNVIYDEEVINIFELRELGKAFIFNSENLDFLPEKEMISIPEIGDYPVATKHVISLKVHEKAKYETYILVLNELIAVYNQLRNDASNLLFDTSFYNLNKEKQDAIRVIYPLRISEMVYEEEEKGAVDK